MIRKLLRLSSLALLACTGMACRHSQPSPVKRGPLTTVNNTPIVSPTWIEPARNKTSKQVATPQSLVAMPGATGGAIQMITPKPTSAKTPKPVTPLSQHLDVADAKGPLPSKTDGPVKLATYLAAKLEAARNANDIVAFDNELGAASKQFADSTHGDRLQFLLDKFHEAAEQRKAALALPPGSQESIKANNKAESTMLTARLNAHYLEEAQKLQTERPSATPRGY